MIERRAHDRRQVYLGEGITFEVSSRARRLDAEAIDMSADGLGVVVTSGAALFGVGEAVTVRAIGAGADEMPAVVRHVGRLESRGSALPRLGLTLVPVAASEELHACPEELPAFATAPSPWFHRETLRCRVISAGARGMHVRVVRPNAPLVPGVELALTLHLPFVGVATARGRVVGVDGASVTVDWIEPTRELLKALSRYLLAGDDRLTPMGLRSRGLAVGDIEHAVSYDYAVSEQDFDDVLALRLRAHQALGHLESTTVEDMRSPYDGHSRHLICRFGARIIGYVRVIWVDGDPHRSQYVSMGGHDVPAWMWQAGFCEAGAGAIDPEFQKAGLFVPLMAHSVRVAVQAGYRYVLGACDDDLLGMYGEMGFELLQTREVEPKPGWRFRSHLIHLDVERLLAGGVSGKAVPDMTEAIRFARYAPSPALAA